MKVKKKTIQWKMEEKIFMEKERKGIEEGIKKKTEKIRREAYSRKRKVYEA